LRTVDFVNVRDVISLPDPEKRSFTCLSDEGFEMRMCDLAELQFGQASQPNLKGGWTKII
jgi:hypothetical protein